MYTTIRKNSLAKIRAILDKAVLITRFSHSFDDDGSSTNQVVTAERVMDVSKTWVAVNVDERGVMNVRFSGGHYTAFPSIEAARHTLVPEAFARYFPAEGIPALERTLDTNIERTKVRLANAFDEIAATREAKQLEHLQLRRGIKRPDALGQVAANDD
jgi:hypothetical protein